MKKYHVKQSLFKIRRHPRFILVFCCICIVFSVVISTHLTRASAYELKQEQITIEVGTSLSECLQDYVEASKAVLKDMELDTSTVNVNQVGTYKMKIIYQNESTSVKIKIVDTTAPVFMGVEDTVILLQEEFDPMAQVSAYDIGSNDVSEYIQISGSIDSSSVGTYQLSYSVSDQAGNQAVAKRQIKVTDNESEASIKVSASDTERQQMLDTILDYLGDDADAVGLVYYDLNTGNSFTINGTTQFRSASTIKVPVVMALYAAADAGELSLNEIMYYQAETDYEGGTGILQNADLSQGYTLSELAEYAITYSDNIAFHMIWRRLGTETCLSYYETIIGHTTNWVTTEMSAADGSAVMKQLYDADTDAMNKLKQDLSNTIFNDRISNLIPKATVAHKIGDYGSYTHDYGIIYDEQPYLLSIYTDGLDGAKTKIAEISKIIYDFQTK